MVDYLFHLTYERGLAQTWHGDLISVICVFDLARAFYAGYSKQ